MDVWVKRDSRWQIVARLGTAIAPPSQAGSTPAPTSDLPTGTVYPTPRNDTEREIFAHWEQMRQGWLTDRPFTATRVLADDYVQIGSTGAVRTKAEILQDQSRGEVRMLALDYRDLNLRVMAMRPS